MNGKKLLNETANIMEGLSFPGNKAEFVKKIYLGKYDGSPASNLEAFQVFYFVCVRVGGSIYPNQHRKLPSWNISTFLMCQKLIHL